MSNLVQRLLNVGFRPARTMGGHSVYENALVRVCPNGDEGTDIPVFSDKLGHSCAYSMHFSGGTPDDVIVAAANKAAFS